MPILRHVSIRVGKLDRFRLPILIDLATTVTVDSSSCSLSNSKLKDSGIDMHLMYFVGRNSVKDFSRKGAESRLIASALRGNAPLLALLVFLFLVSGCKRSSPIASSATTADSSAPASASSVSVPPTPAFSAAHKIGMFVYPKSGQGNDQQLRDEYDCYQQVLQQTSINPEAPPPTAPSSAEVEAAEQQAASQAEQARGGRVRGAARGAAGGAVIGAITGDAGRGAAAGTVVGTMRGGMQQRQSNATAKQQAAQAASSQLQRQWQQANAVYNQKQNTFKRGFSACLDSRGYSVK